MRGTIFWVSIILAATSVQAAADTLRPDQELYLQGANAFDSGEYTTAVSSFQRLLKDHPGSALVCPSHYALAETFYSIQRYAQALQQLNRISAACARQVGRGKVLFRKAWALYRLDRQDQAGGVFNQAAASTGLDTNEQLFALVMAGDIAAESGRYKEAISHYTRVIKGSPPIALACQVQTKIGKAHLKGKNYAGARQAFSTVLQLDPRSEFADDAIYGRAWAMRSAKHYQQAKKNWTHLLSNYAISPLVPEARFRLGEENYRMGNYIDAMLAFDSVPPASDFADDALYWTAWAFYRRGEYSRAAYTFDLARTKFPRSNLNIDARFRAAESHRDAGEYELAIIGYRALVELGPTPEYFIQSLYGMAQSAAMSGDQSAAERYRTELLATRKAGDYAPRVFFDLGVAAYNRKQYAVAIREFESLIERYPRYPLVDEALYELGLSYMREEMYKDAKDALRRCVRHAPEGDAGKNAAYQLGWALFRAGEFVEASNQFLTVASQGGENAVDARYRAGDALYNAGKYPDAINLYQQVIDLSPGSELAATAQNSIGWCYDRLGRPEEAIGSFQIVVDRYPQSQVWDDSAYKVAEYYHSQKDYSLSVPVLEELRDLQVSPFWESSLLMLGEGLWQLKKKDKAMSVLRSLLDRKDTPLREDALLLLADLSWEEERWSQARSYYAQFVEEFPQHELGSRALIRVAESFAAEELWTEAVRAYVRASVAGADQIACLIGRCRASAHLGDCHAAEESANALETRYPANEETGEAFYWAGHCHFDHQMDEHAVRLLLKVPILYPDSEYADDALLFVAQARLRQQRPEQAERQLRMLLDKYPGSPHKTKAERLLTSIGGGE